jgi:hypothetical protein
MHIITGVVVTLQNGVDCFLGGTNRWTIIDRLNLAVLTRDDEDAGSGSDLNVVVNINGNDVVSHFVVYQPPYDIGRGNAGILPVAHTTEHPIQFDSDSLTNSSVRVEITGDDAWKPQHVLLLGRTDPLNNEVVGWIPLAIELDTNIWLSSDTSEGRVSMPVRLVRLGNDSTVIRRVLLLLKTANEDDAGTDDPIELEITAGGSTVLKQATGSGNSTSQVDTEQSSHNWYFLNVSVPFTKGQVLSDGGIKLGIGGKDAWLPREVYVYGFDMADGRPREIVHLVSITDWSLGWLSRDMSEGEDSVPLPVS